MKINRILLLEKLQTLISCEQGHAPSKHSTAKRTLDVSAVSKHKTTPEDRSTKELKPRVQLEKPRGEPAVNGWRLRLLGNTAVFLEVLQHGCSISRGKNREIFLPFHLEG